jgi:hypothetical protein
MEEKINSLEDELFKNQGYLENNIIQLDEKEKLII